MKNKSNRIVVAEGYVYGYGHGPSYFSVGVNESATEIKPIRFRLPDDLFKVNSPKYRIVLEPIE